MTRVFGFSFPSGKRSDRVQTGRFLAHFRATDFAAPMHDGFLLRSSSTYNWFNQEKNQPVCIIGPVRIIGTYAANSGFYFFFVLEI